MIIGSWNIQGLGEASKQAEIRNLTRERNIILFAVLETKTLLEAHDGRCQSIFPRWSCVNYYDYSPAGRIWVCWKPSLVSCTLISKSSQAVHVRVHFGGPQQSFAATFVYGEHTFVDRR